MVKSPIVMNKALKPFALPIISQLSFFKVQESLEKLAKQKNSPSAVFAGKLLNELEKYPILQEGFTDFTLIEKYREPIHKLCEFLFPDALMDNEIKGLMAPFDFVPFYTSRRFDNILKAAGSDFEMTMKGMDEHKMYIMACSAILHRYFHMSVDTSRPIIFEIPNKTTGKSRYYRMAFNVDLLEPIPTERSVMISEEDYHELIDNYQNLDLWKEKFPENSWIMKGLGIINLMDVTMDYSIASIGSNLVVKTKDTLDNLKRNMRAIFNIKDMELGFVTFRNDYFSRIHNTENNSLLLGDDVFSCGSQCLCSQGYEDLITNKRPVAISDVEKYYEITWAPLGKTLLKQGIRSYLIIPLIYEGIVQGYLELGSKRKYELNSASYEKIKDLDPVISMATARFQTDHRNRVEALIQQEYTTIHSSVKWKFLQEAEKYVDRIHNGENPSFEDITFENVYPLYGQLDIRGSSNQRNDAVVSDLVSQLSMVRQILVSAKKANEMPIYEELIFRMDGLLEDLKKGLMAGSENNVLSFLKSEINPVFNYLRKQNSRFKGLIQKYDESIDAATGVIYKARKDFDESVQAVNHEVADFLDERQEEAQRMFPHYFERYKTDGVEYNMYIGPSISKEDSFDLLFLKNLRLWQLITTCQMENRFLELQKSLKVKLEVASLILAYSSPLSIHFRMDEKKFDVEGTYNARYEIVKKRVDKARIKGTDERITTPGKITIIYSGDEDKLEYIKYIHFLESRGLIQKDTLEDHYLEDLQGISGLRALRVEVDYSHKDEPLMYEELMKSL